MILVHLIRLIGYAWASANTLIGLVLGLVYGATWSWFDGCIEGECDRLPGGEWVGGQAHGWCVLFKRGQRGIAEVRVHERAHVVHQLTLGLLFYLAYGAHYLWLRRNHDHMAAYQRVWSERIAYRVQVQFVGGRFADAWGHRLPRN